MAAPIYREPPRSNNRCPDAGAAPDAHGAAYLPNGWPASPPGDVVRQGPGSYAHAPGDAGWGSRAAAKESQAAGLADAVMVS
jgi:hypothetical protein